MERYKEYLNKKNLIIVLVIAAVFAIGAASAYFTDKDAKINGFTVGNVSVVLSEPSWNVENGKNITPNKVIPKDPQITNDGANDAFVFMTVTVPAENVKTVGASGNIIPAAKQDLFTYTVNSGWTLIETDKTTDPKNSIYTYAYTAADGNLNPLKPQAKTASLFNNVKLINLVENQITPNTQLNVNVDVMAIQADDLGTKAPAEVLKMFKDQNK